MYGTTKVRIPAPEITDAHTRHNHTSGRSEREGDAGNRDCDDPDQVPNQHGKREIEHFGLHCWQNRMPAKLFYCRFNGSIRTYQAQHIAKTDVAVGALYVLTGLAQVAFSEPRPECCPSCKATVVKIIIWGMQGRGVFAIPETDEAAGFVVKVVGEVLASRN